jgi:hypothetical protein
MITAELSDLRGRADNHFDDDAERLFGALALANQSLSPSELATLAGVARNTRSLPADLQRYLAHEGAARPMVALQHPGFADGFRMASASAVAVVRERVGERAAVWAQQPDVFHLRRLTSLLIEQEAHAQAAALLCERGYLDRRFSALPVREQPKSLRETSTS